MNTRWFQSGFLLLALLIARAGIPLCSGVQDASAESDGQTLAAQLRDQSPMQNFSGEGILKYRCRLERVEIPVALRIVNEGKQWKSIYEARTTNGASLEKLEITHCPDMPGHYILTLPTASGLHQPARVLAPEQIGIPFASTDFWLCDLGLEFFQWPSQVLVKKEMRKGRSCRVLESMPASPQNSPYARVRSWIDLETHGLIRAEAYDASQKLVKEFEILKIAKIDGKTQLKEMEIRSPLKGSRTRLEFVFDVKDAP